MRKTTTRYYEMDTKADDVSRFVLSRACAKWTMCVCVCVCFVPMEWNVMLGTLTEWQSGHVSSLTITGVRFQARNKYAFRSETDNAPSVMN